MRLRYVLTCHFGKSELTNFMEVLQKHPEFGNPASKHCLKAADVVLLVSMSANQLVFLHSFDAFEDKKVLRSTRFRISGGARWNPLMLANYAKSVGITLTGLAEYEEHIKKHLKD